MSPQREQLEVEAEPAVEQAATIVELPAGTSPRSRGLAPARIAFLQRAAGNAAVAAYLQREAADAGAIAERKPPAPGAAAPAQPDGGEHGSEPRGPGHDGREPAPEGSQPPPPVEGADDSGNRAAGEPSPPRHDVGSGANGKTDKDLQLGKHQQDDEAHGAATDSAHEEAESAAEADAPPPPTAGGGLEAAVAAFATPAPLAAPSAEGEGAQTIVDAVAEAGSAGQAALAGTVGGGAREIASTVDSKIAHVDAAAETEDTALASRFSELRKQLGQSVRRASQQVTAAGVAATTRLDTSHNQAAERAGTAFSTRQERTRQLGVTKGDAAVAAGEQAATSAQGRIEGGAGEARDAGERKAGAATGDSSEVIQGKAAAARQVAGDTAGEITRSVDDTVGQLRGIGPESRPQFVDQANQLAAQLGEQLPSILAQLSQTHGDAAGSVDQAAAAGAGSIDQLGATLTRSLAELELNLRRGLRSGAAQSKQSLTAAGREAIASVQREHESAAQAGADLVATVLASVGNRRIRRAAAGEIAAKLALQVRGGYTSTEDMARIGLAQTAQCFATAALEVQEAIRAQAGAARGEAGRFAGDAQGQATAAQVQVAQQLLQMAVSAATAEEGIVSGAERTLDEAVGDLDTRFTTALADLAAQLEQRVGEAVTNAREPLGTLEGRMDEAMQRADERMHESWLEQQIDEAVESIDWGFVAGLVVGLLVTIAVVALLGTGIGALILAGALAGALSVAATTLTNDAIHHRETNWGELGRNMLVGAAFGAIGGAIGGGVSAGLGARVASGVMTEATMIAISKASNVGVGAALGVVQNVIHGDPWDRNLLLNIGTGVAMTYGPGGRAIEGMTETARAGAIDSGLAVESSITPTERAQANARAEARAAGGEGAPPAPAPSPDAAAATSDTGVPAATSDTGVPAATSDTGGPAATSDTGVPAATSDTGGPAATSDTGGPAATSDTGGPAATSDTGGPAATSDTGGPSGGGVTSEPEQGAPRAPRSNTDEPAGAGARDTQPTGFEDEPTVPGGAPVEDEPTTTESGQEAEGRATVEDIASQLPDETVMQPPDPTSAADARLMYDNCMAESPTREAAIYRNTETGEYIVVQGNENTAQVAPGEDRRPAAARSAGRRSSTGGPTSGGGSSRHTRTRCPRAARRFDLPTASRVGPPATWASCTTSRSRAGSRAPRGSTSRRPPAPITRRTVTTRPPSGPTGSTTPIRSRGQGRPSGSHRSRPTTSSSRRASGWSRSPCRNTWPAAAAAARARAARRGHRRPLPAVARTTAPSPPAARRRPRPSRRARPPRIRTRISRYGSSRGWRRPILRPPRRCSIGTGPGGTPTIRGSGAPHGAIRSRSRSSMRPDPTRSWPSSWGRRETSDRSRTRPVRGSGTRRGGRSGAGATRAAA